MEVGSLTDPVLRGRRDQVAAIGPTLRQARPPSPVRHRSLSAGAKPTWAETNHIELPSRAAVGRRDEVSGDGHAPAGERGYERQVVDP